MECASCRRVNRAGARFCSGCGAALAPRCPACGAELEAGARFCDACGAGLASPAAGDASVARKVVTILFADLVGSTSVQERLDAESTRRVMELYYAAMRGAVEAHGGTVVQLLGDGVMCAFGVPHVAEDDAIRAVRAAVAMQQAFADFAREQRPIVGELGMRIALNTGEVVVSDERPAGIGDPLNVAGRLQQEAREGDVLIGESTRRLVAEQVTLAHFGTFALKGRAEPVPAFRVVSLERPAGAPAIAFVGREDELRRLTAAFDTAVAAPGTRLAAVLGSPGLGKSRLIGELTRRLGERATVLSARCDPAGGATFAPLAESLRMFLGFDTVASADAVRATIAESLPADEPERARIAAGVAALIAGTPASPEETFFTVRRFLAALAARRPVVLSLDDVQWAEPLLLDLAEHLVQWGGGAPLLLLVAARPELRDTRSSLAVPGGFVADVVTLAGLDAGAATRLAANVIGAEALPAAIAGRVLAASEGNPLFVGELVRMLVHDGALKREGDRWTAAVALAEIEMPPTIHALLAARIERLRPEERTVLERAAVVGRHFSRAALAQLLPREVTDLDARLESLRRAELLEPDTGWFLGEPVLRFHHALIRDAAYRRVLRGTRAELHARFADWVAARAGDSLEHDETLGWHLEQAHQQLRELGPIDARGRELGERAARHLATAGRRALAREDLAVAASLLGRALELLDGANPARADLALAWCEALLASGEVTGATRAVAELARLASDSSRLRAWHVCFAGQLAVMTDPQSLHATAAAVAAAAEALSAAGDTAGEAKAHSVHALALARLGKGAACEAALDRALAAARRADDRRLANAVLAGAPLAALWGPSPVTRASGRCLDVVRVLRITQGAPAVEAVALRCQAVLEALRGRSDAARRMISASRGMVEELGLTQQLLETDVFAGHIGLLEGDAPAAEKSLRRAYDGLREQGLGIDAARAAALLARALLAQGRAAEAEVLSHESESLAGDDLQAAIAWRGARAEALARRGAHAHAVEFARAAVEIAAATDALLHHADARLALATALRAAGRRAEADTEERRARELWEAKGASLLAERARREVPAPEAVTPAPSEKRVRRRVRPNAATAHVARFDALLASRDAEGISRLYADEMVTVHHPTRTEFGREAQLIRLRMLMRAEGVTLGGEVLATLGDSLALRQSSMSLTALGEDDFAPFGPIDTDTIILVEVPTQGRQRRAEIFAQDRLGDAIVRLYERWAESLPEGAERERAAATARTAALLVSPFDLARYSEALASDLAFVDHQPLGLGTAPGAGGLASWVGSLSELADELAMRVDDVLALRADGLLVRTTSTGRLRAGGGPYEQAVVQLFRVGADGRVARVEWFDPSQTEAALARFDELSGDPRAARFSNAALRSVAELERRWSARDWPGVAALFAPGYRLDDRRAVVGLPMSGHDFVVNLRSMFELPRSEWRVEPLATRGDTLALLHTRLTGEAHGGGEVAFENLSLIEVDGAGLRTAGVLFDLEELDAAYTELDARYAAGEGAPHLQLLANLRTHLQAIGANDMAAVRRILPPDLTVTSHRKLASWGKTLTRDEYLASYAGLGDFGDLVTRVRADHVSISPAAGLVVTTGRGTFGGSAFERPLVTVFTHDGTRSRSLEEFDFEQLDLALARFEELNAESLEDRFANVASRTMERFARRWRDRDWAGVLDTFVPTHRMDDRRKLMRVEIAGDEFLANERMLFDEPASRWRGELLATRGERLALLRMKFTTEVDGSGPMTVEMLDLVEVDDAGKRTQLVVFDPDSLEAAYAELDLRYAAGEGAPWTELLAHQREVGRALGSDDAAAVARLLPDDFTSLNHQRFGGTGQRVTRDQIVANGQFREDLDVRGDMRLDHVLRISARAAVAALTWHGTLGGGAFENSYVVVATHDGRRLHAWETFDADQLDRALARYEALIAERVTPRIENSATRTIERYQQAWAARDPRAAAATLAPGFRQIDRRRLMRLDLDKDQFLAFSREVFDITASRLESEIVATRGDRLALARLRFTGAGRSVGPTEIESLAVIEADAHGDRLAMVRFDSDSLDAAYAELDDRYAAGEAAPYASIWRTMRGVLRAFTSRDWARLASVLTPDLVFEDHRVLGSGALASRDEYVARLRALVDLAPDVVMRIDHVLALDERGALMIGKMLGSREGGEFEIPMVTVRVLGPDGRIRHWHAHDLEQLGEARTRFESLRPVARASRPENAATRARTESGDPLAALAKPNLATAAMDRSDAAFAAREWSAMRSEWAADAVLEDRRPHVLASVDIDRFIASLQEVVSASPDVWSERRLVSTAGDHIAIEHRTSGASGAGTQGEFELEALWLIEAADDGRIAAVKAFEFSDWRAALQEARTRVIAREESVGLSPHFKVVDAWNARDRAGMRSLMSDDYVLEDHRLVSVGRLEGGDAYLESVGALWDLASDICLDSLFTLASGPWGGVFVDRLTGTLADGGAFENQIVTLSLVARGLVTRIEFFELGDAHKALARFAELRPDPLSIPPNAATRAADRLEAAFEAGDWSALETFCVPELVFDDRRPFAQLTGDRDTFLASSRVLVSEGGRFTRQVLATAGDRLSLERRRWTTSAAGVVDSEIAFLCVTEVDTEGRFVAIVAFDPDARRAAGAELRERYERDPSTPPLLRSPEFFRALRDRDLEGIRRELPENFVFIDRRRIGAGRLEGLDAYIAWQAALYEQSPDAFTETLYYPAADKHALLAVVRMFGTLASGGEFESVFALLGTLGGLELFDLEDLELARARFEELRPDSLRIPPNSAARLSDSIQQASDARDWDGLAALCSPDLSWDDRRRRSLVVGGRDTFVASVRVMVTHGSRVERTLLATAGDRLCLQLLRRAGATADIGGFESENLALNELDAEGRVIAIVGFDPDDRRAASLEMFERWARSAEARSVPAATLDAIRAMNAHDLERLLAALPRDFVLHDHRRVGLGRIEGADAFAESLAAAFALAEDFTVETLYVIANESHGELAMARAFGTLAGGGEFEAVYLRVIAHAGTMELFEPDDLTHARARFAELGERAAS